MASVGYATLDIIPSLKGLQGQLDKGTAGPLRSSGAKGGTLFGDAAGKSAGSRFGSVFSKAAKAGMIGLAAAGAGAIKLGVDSISAASDLEESTNKVAQVFGDAADKVLKFTAGTADALGQTNQQAREAAATFGIFGSAAGLADKKNARFAKRMTTLASDLASFNNTDPAQAVEALGAALRGESEPIRAYGVMLDEATLKAEAMRLGLLKPVKDESKIRSYQVRIMEGQKAYNDAVAESGEKSIEALKAEANLGTLRESLRKATEGSIPPLTQQQKLLSAQSEIFKQTGVAQGDFARTSDGLANQQRRLAARFEDAKARLGTGLLPIMTKAADFLLDKGIPAFERFADWFNKKGIPALQDFGDQVEPVLGTVKDLVGAFNDLPKGGKLAALAGTLAGGIVVKHKLSGIFDRGGIANPMFVTVTNPGLGGGGGGGLFGGSAKGGVAGAAATFGSRSATFFKGALTKGLWVTAGLTVADQIWKAADGNSTAPMKWAYRVGDAIHKGFVSKLGNQNTTKTQSNGEANPWASIYEGDPKKVSARIDTVMDATRAKAAGLGRELDLVGARKVTPRINKQSIIDANDALAKFIGYQIDAGRPVTPYINTTSIERAIALARTLDAELRPHAVPTAGVDNGAGYMHGGTGTTGGTDERATIGTVNIVAHDYNDFLTQAQRRTQSTGLGGFR